jgi:phosphoglucomutase
MDCNNKKERIMSLSAWAGRPAEPSMLVNVPRLMTAYYAYRPDPAVPGHHIAFGTSGHRGSAFEHSFNEAHILAMSQAICLYRRQEQIDGPLFLGIDTHALSESAFASALEVLAANGVEVMIDEQRGYTPTPVISHAILQHNHDPGNGLADGIVITPSHNPPEDGGFKYNPPHGGPGDTHVTDWIQTQANALLAHDLKDVKRMPFEQAQRASTTHRYDYMDAYISDLTSVVDLEVLRGASLHLGVDPLGGAGVDYWGSISDRYRLPLRVVNEAVDPTFRFMTLDWDGKIRSVTAPNGQRPPASERP